MKLTEQKYRADRGNTAETYQSFTAKVEMEGNRRYLTVELDNLTRWRSKEEYADYLRWAAEEIERLPICIEQLEQQLSRYAGAVEVEGCWITERGNIHVPSCNQSLDHIEANKKVRVLVMEEVE